MPILLALVAGLLSTSPRPAGAPVLVVANPDESTVSVVDVRAARILATLPTGQAPREVTASPDGRWAVVTDQGTAEGGSSLTVVDLITLTVARRIRLDGHPRPSGIRFLPDNQTVVVISDADGSVLLVGIPSGRILRIVTTEQAGSRWVVTPRDGRRAYTATPGSGSVSVIDLGGPGVPRTLAVAPGIESIAVSPDGAVVWVGSNQTGRIYVIDAARWTVVDSTAATGRPGRIAFSPDGSRVLVADPAADEVRLFDAGRRELLARIPVPPGEVGNGSPARGPARPAGLAFGPSGRTAWVSLAGVAQIAEVDLVAGAVRRYLPARAGAAGLVYTERPPA